MSNHPSHAMANRHSTVTSQPVSEKPLRMVPKLVPVCSKKVPKTLICHNRVMPVMNKTTNVSMARSDTTVPKAFGNDTPSQRFNTPQRANSPMRGMSRLTA